MHSDPQSSCLKRTQKKLGGGGGSVMKASAKENVHISFAIISTKIVVAFGLALE